MGENVFVLVAMVAPKMRIAGSAMGARSIASGAARGHGGGGGVRGARRSGAAAAAQSRARRAVVRASPFGKAVRLIRFAVGSA